MKHPATTPAPAPSHDHRPAPAPQAVVARRRLWGCIGLFALCLALSLQGLPRSADRASAAPIAEAAAAASPARDSCGLGYLPACHVNQGGEPTPHVEAF